MKNRIFIASVLAAATVAVAQADTVHYSFSYAGTNGQNASGWVSVNNLNCAFEGSITVTGSGAGNGTYGLYTGFAADGNVHSFITNDIQWTYDNNFNCNDDGSGAPPFGGIVSDWGIAFQNASGYVINIWANSATDYAMYGGTTFGNWAPGSDHGTMECHKQPAPGALGLLGVAGLVGGRRRRS